MADLSIDCGGIKSPNPFWLASGPPTNTGDQVMRAFDHGWGGAVWKTLGVPIQNVSSRYGAIGYPDHRLIGLNNIELITDRPLEVNLREIAEVKRRYPDHAVIASLMVESRREWEDLVKRCEDAGVDGLELNFGCPHGMCERGMGSAVGQEPRVLEEITGWVTSVATVPVFVKLTPNVTDITVPGRAAVRAGCDGLSLVNTFKSIIGVNLDTMVPIPEVGDGSSSGGYCGEAIRPIALHMVCQLARDPEVTVPLSGIGGISNWRHAAEYLALGATSVQVCTAVMHYGFRIVEEMIEGLDDFLDAKGFGSVRDLIGRALPQYMDWGDLDLNYKRVARIDTDSCIECELCYIACWDGAHQSIHLDRSDKPRVPRVEESTCTGCNLCHLVCPVPGCITMQDVQTGLPRESWNERMAASS